MGAPDQNRIADEITRLRGALDEETFRRLELRTRLERANSDFEEFISLAAHNLREPLRDVTSFTQLLAKTCAGRLDSEASEYLKRIQEGATSVQTQLAAIVDYWTAGTGDLQFSPTDMEAALRQALLCADKQITERTAIITHDPLPEVSGDIDTLTKTLHHLVRNAIDYCDTPSPRVHISCSQTDGEWVFGVRDNGPGIDPAFQGRLFMVFKRLHGKEHPGNGLGLAFCKRVIEWHGGRIWLDSKPGTGSTFYFTVPID